MKPAQNLTLRQKAIANVPMPLVLTVLLTLGVSATGGPSWPKSLLVAVPIFVVMYGISWYSYLTRQKRLAAPDQDDTR